MYKKVEVKKWSVQGFESHILISYDGATKSRINMNDRGFDFTGLNPYKQPKSLQAAVNNIMKEMCETKGLPIWNVEAWQDYGNSKVVF